MDDHKEAAEVVRLCDAQSRRGLVAWMVAGIVLFSYMARLHPRYVEGFTPAVASLLGIGAAWASAARTRAATRASPARERNCCLIVVFTGSGSLCGELAAGASSRTRLLGAVDGEALSPARPLVLGGLQHLRLCGPPSKARGRGSCAG